MAKEGVMGCSEKNGTKRNTYIGTVRRKWYKGAMLWKYWRKKIMFSQSDTLRKLSIKVKNTIKLFFLQILNIKKKILPCTFSQELSGAIIHKQETVAA